MIVLTGTNCSKNLGDAMLQICYANLSKKIGIKKIFLNTPNFNIDVKFYKKYGVSCFKSSRKDMLLIILSFTSIILFKLFKKNFFLTKELIIFNESAYIVDLSGDMLTESHGLPILISHIIPILYSILLKKKIYLISQSIGPFKKSKFFINFILNRVEKISLRDSISHEYIQNFHSINKNKIFFNTDLGFLLSKKFCKKFQYLESKKIMGISVSSLYSSNVFKNSNEFDKFILEIINFSIKNKYEIFFFVHVHGPKAHNDDYIFSKYLINNLKIRAKIISNASPEKMKYAISKCKIFIGARFHACISSISSGVPTLALSYSHKSTGILKDLSLSSFLISKEDLSEVNVIYKKLTQIEKNYKKIKSIFLNKSKILNKHEISKNYENIIKI